MALEPEPGEVVDSLVGKQVEYAKEDGGKRSGMVIHHVEAKNSVYFIKFDDDFLIYVYDLVKTSWAPAWRLEVFKENVLN